jgi:hypothetical protein
VIVTPPHSNNSPVLLLTYNAGTISLDRTLIGKLLCRRGIACSSAAIR